MSRTFGILLVVLFVVGLAAVEVRADGPLEFKLAVIAPKGTQWEVVAERIAKEILDNTNGRIKVTWYFGGVMGDEKDVITKIRFGQLQGGGFTLMGMGIITDEIKVLEMPYLFAGYEEKGYVLKKMDTALQEVFRKKGFVNVGWTEIGFVQLFSHEDIKTLDQFRKTKMWLWGGDMLVQGILEAYGFRSLIPMDLASVLPSLQTGMLQSFFGTYYTTVAMQWYTFAKSMMHDTFVYTPAAILVSKATYDKIPKELLPVFHAAWDRYLPVLVEQIQKDDIEAFEGMKANGARVIAFDAKDTQFLHDQAKVVWDQYAGKLFPKSLLEDVLAARDEYRRKQGKQP